MARFHGAVGFSTGQAVETSPGVYEQGVKEVVYKGYVSRIIKKYDTPDAVNGELKLNHQIQITADDYALDNLHNILYVVWQGVKWSVQTVEVERPHLTLYFGSKYNA